MKKEPKSCAEARCGQTPAKGEWCWYHAKVVAGLLDPISPQLYPKKIIEGAHKREDQRFKRDLALLASAVD